MKTSTVTDEKKFCVYKTFDREKQKWYEFDLQLLEKGCQYTVS